MWVTVAPEASLIAPDAVTGNPYTSVTFTATVDSSPVTRSPPSGKKRRLTAGTLLLAAAAAVADFFAPVVLPSVPPAEAAVVLFKCEWFW